MNRHCAVSALLDVILCAGNVATGTTVTSTTLVEPNGTRVTPEAISGNVVAGVDNNGSFIYNLASNTWTTGLGEEKGKKRGHSDLLEKQNVHFLFPKFYSRATQAAE